MLNFNLELKKLLAGESGSLESSEFGLLVSEGTRLLAALDKKQADLSLQVEEIYDIVKESGAHKDTLRLERTYRTQLLNAVVGLSDMIEDFLRYSAQSGVDGLETQARMMWNNVGNMLQSCSISRFGEAGQPLDPEIHSVQAAEVSGYPREHISNVLQSGYRYMGALIRKASIIVSTGAEDIGEINLDE